MLFDNSTQFSPVPGGMTDEEGGLANGSAPTAAIETVSVGRPLKVLSLMLLVAGTIAFFLATASASWLQTSVVRVGLWEECYMDNVTTPEGEGPCSNSPCNKGYARICGIFSVCSIVLCILAVVLMVQAMKMISPRCKVITYNLCILACALAAILFLVPLVGYPMMFMQEITAHKIQAKGFWWQLGWAYGAGWVGIIFSISSILVLKLDKPQEEIVYREKVCRTVSNTE